MSTPLRDTALLGRWELRRTVTDRLTGRRGTVHGELTVVAGPSRIGWQERGLLDWGGRVFPVTRTSYLVDTPDGPWMTFADGRLFHPWLPGVDVEHPCGADLYRGRVEIGVEEMTTVWRVTGPQKDQLLSTGLTRRGVAPVRAAAG